MSLVDKKSDEGALRPDEGHCGQVAKGRIGERLRRLREKHGLTQDELGGKLGVDKTAVSAWENGRYLPRTSHRAALAELLGVSLEALFAETPGALDGDGSASAVLVDTERELPEVLMQLTRRARRLSAFRLAAPYTTAAYVQEDWRKLVAARILARELEVQRIEICYGLARLKEILSNIFRFDGHPYFVKVCCPGLRDCVPAFGGYIFDEAEALIGAYWASTPPTNKPGLRLSGAAIRSFFASYWSEIWSRGTWLNSRGRHDLAEVHALALALGLEPEKWSSFVAEAEGFEVGDGAPPLV